MPTPEWQDQLAARLSRNTVEDHCTGSQQSPSRASSGAPLPQRRRLDDSSIRADLSHPNWNEMYIMEASSGGLSFRWRSSSVTLTSSASDSADTDESQCATAFGQLSLDENREVRYTSIDTFVYSRSPGPVSRESLWSPLPYSKRSRP